MNSLLRFALIGALGFLVDGGLLSGLVTLAGVDALRARFVSFSAAVTVTYVLNRALTFRDTTAQPGLLQWAHYMTVNAVGALINLSVYVAMVAMIEKMAKEPMVPLALGAAVSLMFNYAASRRLVFHVNR